VALVVALVWVLRRMLRARQKDEAPSSPTPHGS
jgi:flagellar biogenesis protein FliO